MAPERLAKFLNVPGFRPFILHVGDGRSLEVNHPEMAALLKGRRTLLVSTEDGSSHLIDVFLITGVEVRTAADWDGAVEMAL